MITELINTGSELLLGRVLNTHQQWLCRQLADCVVAQIQRVAARRVYSVNLICNPRPQGL